MNKSVMTFLGLGAFFNGQEKKQQYKFKEGKIRTKSQHNAKKNKASRKKRGY